MIIYRKLYNKIEKDTLKTFPRNMNKKVGNIRALKNPKAIPNKSPIKGSQLNKAIQDPYLLTFFSTYLFSLK